MSKPESTGESLEAILASIRRSLSEQSTDLLEEEASAPADMQEDAESAPSRRDGLARRLAESAEEAPQVVAAAEPDTRAPVEEPPPSAPPSPSAPAPAAVRAQKDPLWFLGGRGQPAAKENVRAADTSATASADGKASTAKSAAARAARGPLPPFFGSSAEAQKAEVVLLQPSPPSVGTVLPPVAPPPPYLQNGGPEAARAPAGAEGHAAEAARNGKANAFLGHAAADGKSVPGGDTPHIHALEAVVLELLRPMLQRWLDENMPRLVSAALKDQAARLSERDSRKP